MFYYKNNFVLYTTRGIPSTLKIKKILSLKNKPLKCKRELYQLDWFAGKPKPQISDLINSVIT